MANWIDAVASRSGPLLTAATHFTITHGLEGDPPRGVGGLHTLSTLIVRAALGAAGSGGLGARDEDDALDEREFVAGAGAYLALLLLDHLPHGAHVASSGEHRLRLGAHGFFDPFAAVEAALNAKDAPRALIESVKCAEAEAAGRGPIARVVKTLSGLLNGESRVRILEHFDHHMWLDVDGTRQELDLSRVINATAQASEPFLQHAVERVIAGLLEQAAPVFAWEAAREVLIPRLVGPAFLQGVPNADDLYLQPLAPDVWETFVLRFGERERARYVRRIEVETWAASGAQTRRQAIANLARASERARFMEHDTDHGPMVVAQTRDNLDAARLLLPGLYGVLAPSLGKQFLVATPHRDSLLASAVSPEGLIRELRERTESAIHTVPHAISKQLWLVTGPGTFRPFRQD